jgi:flagellin-like protein
MRKGITPIISIIVLLLITVALAGVAWIYLSGFLDTTIRTVTVPPNGIYCAGIAGVKVVVTNTGTEDLIEGPTGIAILEMNGGDAGFAAEGTCTLSPTPLISKQTGTVTCGCEDAASAAVACAGDLAVSIGSAGALQTVRVRC